MKEQSQAKLSIYLADNTEDDKSVFDYFNTNDKYNVVGHNFNGETVLKEVVDLKPDFLIMEPLLSGMDGFMVLEKLKKSMDKMPKVIFISNLSHSGFVSKAIREGVSYFMVKPINPQNLEERMLDIQYPVVKNESQERYLDEKISNIFITIGIPAHIKGYQFLREAVKLAIEEPEIIEIGRAHV